MSIIETDHMRLLHDLFIMGAITNDEYRRQLDLFLVASPAHEHHVISRKDILQYADFISVQFTNEAIIEPTEPVRALRLKD